MLPIDKQVVLARMNGIEKEVGMLKKLAELSYDTYKTEPNFQLGEYHLHRGLEGVFNIAAHINSRKAGGSSGGGYKDIARTYGELGFIEKDFAQNNLVKMAGYRNRLVHFYADITPEETYKLITSNIDDFTVFLQSVRKVLEHPELFGVTVE